jgi:hypothetical protein
MKTPPIERKSKRSPGNFGIEEIRYKKGACHTSIGSSFPGLLDGHFRNIGGCDFEVVLGQPNGVTTGSTPYFQCGTAWYWPLQHHIDEVEIRSAHVPWGGPGSVSIFPAILIGHGATPWVKQVSQKIKD